MDDLSTLMAIAKKAITQSVEADQTKKIEIIEGIFSNISDWIEQDDCVYLKAVTEDKVLGFILNKNYWNLSDLFVLPSEHGKGVGKRLLQEAIKVCKQYSDKPTIRVNSSFNAVGFYKNFGFVKMIPKVGTPDYVVSLEYFLSSE